MRKIGILPRSALAWIAVAVTGSLPALGQAPLAPPAPEGWKDSAELSYVVTSGNAETGTLGFKDKLWRKWERSGFELNAGGVRAESTTITRTAVGTVASFSVDEQSTTALTTESYFLNSRRLPGHPPGLPTQCRTRG